jgi:hypothetical protein
MIRTKATRCAWVALKVIVFNVTTKPGHHNHEMTDEIVQVSNSS